MQNPNALIAMALISHNANNPYTVFCEYIKYCIYANAEDTMTLPEIRNAVGDEFGLFLPYNVAIKLYLQRNAPSISDHLYPLHRNNS